VIASLLLLATIQDGPFTVVRDGATARVSADRPAIAGDVALRSLAGALGWTLRFNPESLQQELALHSLDLAFDRQSARTVAHLVAVACGADVVFDDRTGPDGPTTILHVVPPPAADTDTGRQRLRSWATQWYQAFLADDLKVDPTVVAHGLEARRNLGQLLLELGELDAARRWFQSVYEHDPLHPGVPQAMLAITNCHYELGEYEQAERWARLLAVKHPRLPETAAATVLLARVLIARGYHDECVRFLESAMLPLAGTPEAIDLMLLLAEVHRLRGRADRTYDEIQKLGRLAHFRELTQRQWNDYHFLRGIGAEAGMAETPARGDEAIEAFEVFLGSAPDDPRRGIALVVLGRAYLGRDLFLEARAAARAALGCREQLPPEWYQEARILDAKSALAVLDRERAFEELEVEVRRPEGRMPELVLFLARSLLEVGRYERAIATAQLLFDRSDRHGDCARVLAIEAMLAQAEAGSVLAEFPSRALPLARGVAGEESQREVATLFGQAWQKLGDVERAADAYRGLLR
jgi:tetratricopeptide (TPR) repeat protein